MHQTSRNTFICKKQNSIIKIQKTNENKTTFTIQTSSASSQLKIFESKARPFLHTSKIYHHSLNKSHSELWRQNDGLCWNNKLIQQQEKTHKSLLKYYLFSMLKICSAIRFICEHIIPLMLLQCFF